MVASFQDSSTTPKDQCDLTPTAFSPRDQVNSTRSGCLLGMNMFQQVGNMRRSCGKSSSDPGQGIIFYDSPQDSRAHESLLLPLSPFPMDAPLPRMLQPSGAVHDQCYSEDSGTSECYGHAFEPADFQGEVFPSQAPLSSDSSESTSRQENENNMAGGIVKPLARRPQRLPPRSRSH